MEQKQTIWSIGAVCAIAALLGCLVPAPPAGAKDAQPVTERDPVVPIVVVDAPARRDAARAVENEAVSSDLLAPLFDVPLPAWVLLGTCLLCARFGPRALSRFQDDAEEVAPKERKAARETGETGLTRPRRFPG